MSATARIFEMRSPFELQAHLERVVTPERPLVPAGRALARLDQPASALVKVWPRQPRCLTGPSARGRRPRCACVFVFHGPRHLGRPLHARLLRRAMAARVERKDIESFLRDRFGAALRLRRSAVCTSVACRSVLVVLGEDGAIGIRLQGSGARRTVALVPSPPRNEPLSSKPRRESPIPYPSIVVPLPTTLRCPCIVRVGAAQRRATLRRRAMTCCAAPVPALWFDLNVDARRMCADVVVRISRSRGAVEFCMPALEVLLVPARVAPFIVQDVSQRRHLVADYIRSGVRISSLRVWIWGSRMLGLWCSSSLCRRRFLPSSLL
ncbi:hypothetical protein BJ912DRAFT_1063001 [Pholiota molesta]|nr:hypothetical protein BJ912DRAFT_1063001 [Pholiota molesta]